MGNYSYEFFLDSLNLSNFSINNGIINGIFNYCFFNQFKYLKYFNKYIIYNYYFLFFIYYFYRKNINLINNLFFHYR